jgi:hypothetical protein
MKSAARAVEDALHGFRFHDELPATATTEGGGFRDERLGYAMEPLGDGWELDTKGVLGDVTAIGSSVAWRVPGRQEVTLGAVCVLEEGHDESWMVDLLTGMIADQAAKELRGRPPQREKTVLGGQPAERLRWPGVDGVEVLLTNRDRTFYFLVSEHRGPPVLTLEDVTLRFSLLD